MAAQPFDPIFFGQEAYSFEELAWFSRQREKEIGCQEIAGASGPAATEVRRTKRAPIQADLRPRTLLEITRVTAQRQLEMEQEAVMYLEGRSSKGAWVMQDRTRGVIAQWDDVHGYSFIEEQEMGDKVFVKQAGG